MLRVAMLSRWHVHAVDYAGFVAKLDPTGACLWQKLAGSKELAQTRIKSVALGPSGAIFLAGEFDDSIDLGCGAMTSAGDTDVFIAALDGAGQCQWQVRGGDGDEQKISDLAVGPDGSVLITGSFQGAIDFGCGEMTSDGFSGMYVTKLDPDGVCLWHKHPTGEHSEQGTAITTTSSGGVFVAASFFVTINLGCGPLEGFSSYRLLAQLDESGNLPMAETGRSGSSGRIFASGGCYHGRRRSQRFDSHWWQLRRYHGSGVRRHHKQWI